MKVSLFTTCLVDSLFPNVAEAMVKILDRYGVEVDFPHGQTCCGQPAFNSGYVDEAREVAKTLLDAFDQSEYVVAPSGSCTGMIHHYYADLFAGLPDWEDKAERLINKTYEFSQFMVNVLGVTDLGARFPHRVAYHPSCHGARLLGIKNEPEQLLDHIQDIQMVNFPHAHDCCGFGGTFAIKMSDISGAMVEEKTKHVVESEAEVLVSTDMGCLMNIDGRLRYENQKVQVKHLAEVLYEGLPAEKE